MKKYNIRDKRFIVLLFIVFQVCSALNAFSTEKISPVIINKVTTIVKFQSGKPAYIVTGAGTALEKRITQRLSVYLSKVLGSPTRIVSNLKAVPAKAPAIILSSNQKTSFGIVAPKTSPEGFALASKIINSHSLIIAAGNTELGLKRAVQRLILKSEQRAPGLVIPELNLSESPWIAQREWTICPWAPDRVRRSFSNPAVDKRNNIWLYSDQQIADYVEMFDWFGFSGSQLMETCANYAAMGSPEAFQDKQLKFAKAVRENGQNVTYWVWAAQFDDYGWFDPEVTYTPEKGKTAFEDPKVRAAFEKYYNGYAKMAPYVDLLIAHFYDPGSLTNREDVFSYLKLLQDKFKAKNPGIKLGVDFWAAGSPSEYMEQLISHGFGNSLLLEMSMPSVYAKGKREALHQAAKERNLKMGMWGWYMTEYETDQMPMMNVNARALKGFYQQIKNSVHKIQPITYWSEMEAYHLNNIFTMYASSQLLWDPERNTDEILNEIAEGIWGPRNGPQVLEAIKLIEDTRSGPTWNTFFWTTKEYRLGTENPEGDLKRAEQAISNFEKMETDTSYVSKFPLPFPPSTFIELTLPHLKQIKQFAQFRIKVEEIRKAAKTGASKTDLSCMANEAWQPILEYNTWIGSFGQPEATMQEKMLNQLAKEFQFEVKIPGWMLYRDANRYLQRIQNIQRNVRDPYRFRSDARSIRAAEFTWSDAKASQCMQLLIKEGAVVPAGSDTYQLANWEEYKLR
jgi:hypothetical protein